MATRNKTKGTAPKSAAKSVAKATAKPLKSPRVTAAAAKLAKTAKASPDGGKPKRGRTAATTKAITPNPTHRGSAIEKQTQATRPIGPGAGPRRGDRRDMHPLFSTGKTKTKGGKRGPIGRSTRKGGAND